MNPYETSQTQLDPNRSPVAQNPMINSSTVIAPVIQIGQPPAQSNESVLQMMQMMQMQQMMQMMQQKKEDKPTNIIVNTSNNNQNTNTNTNTHNNTNGTECGSCRMLTDNYARKIHGKSSMAWCLSLTFLTGGLIFCCFGFNQFDRCKDTEVICAVCQRRKGLLET